MQIVPLAPIHAADAARLHIAGQPGTFLTALGPDVLAAIYRALPATKAGFGFAAIGDELGNEVEGEVEDSAGDKGALAGFISATTGVGKLFTEISTTALGTLLPPLLRQLARH